MSQTIMQYISVVILRNNTSENEITAYHPHKFHFRAQFTTSFVLESPVGPKLTNSREDVSEQLEEKIPNTDMSERQCYTYMLHRVRHDHCSI